MRMKACSSLPYRTLKYRRCRCSTFTVCSRAAPKETRAYPVCKAVTFRGAVTVRCQEHVLIKWKSKEIVGSRLFCRNHQSLYLQHSACGHCYAFLDYGSYVSCSTLPLHVTHMKCAMSCSPEGKIICSHCLQPGDIKHKVSVTTKDLRPRAVVSGIAEERASRFDIGSSLLYFMERGFVEKAERIILRMSDCGIAEPSWWADGSMLMMAIRRGFVDVVFTMRTLGAPLLPLHIMDVAEHFSPEMLSALEIGKPYPASGNHLTSRLLSWTSPSGLSVLAFAALTERWTFLESFLELVTISGVDPSMHLSVGGQHLLEAQVTELFAKAPTEVQKKFRHALNLHESSKHFLKMNIVIEDLSRGSERFAVRVVDDVGGPELPDFVYTTRVVDQSGILSRRTDSDLDSLMCWCKDGCTSDCPCSSSVYDDRGRAREESLNAAFLECSSDCMCSIRCKNRVAQKGATYPIEVFRTVGSRGWAVRALCQIPSGAFVGEYTGELLTDTDANRRIDNYLFETTVGEESHTVDARLKGNFTRFINHSCAPNSKVCMVVWDWQKEQLSHICVFAARNIKKGEEITISYGEHWWRSKVAEFACMCGAPVCEFTEERRAAILRREGGSLGGSSNSGDDESETP